MTDLYAPLDAIVGERDTLKDAAAMQPYLTGWRGGHVGKVARVLFPCNVEQVAEIVQYCAEKQIPITPQGGNTGLVGGSVPDGSGHGIVLHMKHFNAIRTVDAPGFTITAEAGVILQTLQEKASEHRRLFPLSMASEGSSMVGGFVATNAGGTAVLRYGTTRELVLGIEAVLPNGEIFNGLSSLRKDNTGYDLKQLLIGSEGTLGIVTAATFRLFPAHAQKETAMVAVASVADAIALYAHARATTNDQMLAFELIAHPAMALTEKEISGARNPFPQPSPYYVLLELASATADDSLRNTLEKTLEMGFTQGLIADAVIANSLHQAKSFWHIREHITEALRKAGRGIHFDISLPISHVAAFMEKTDALLMQHIAEVQLIAFGHMGDGNIHYNMYLPKDIADAEFQSRKQRAKEIVYEQLFAHHGSISAEHGIGVERVADLSYQKSPAQLAAMRAIKHALDPHNIMNPGKIFPA